MDYMQEIAQCAARLVVEDGKDFASAKIQAVRVLGLPARCALPSNAQLESAVRTHIALFCPESQALELRALRVQALVWMQRLAEFNPFLSGAVWNGTATQLSPIYLQLFCEDPKMPEIFLLNQGFPYTQGQAPRSHSGISGQSVPQLTLEDLNPDLGCYVTLHLTLYDYDDIRGGGFQRRREEASLRGNRQSLLQLLDEVE